MKERSVGLSARREGKTAEGAVKYVGLVTE